ncbi:helix-turn-helix domain-containing protein [Desulfosporosinus shakirovi]|uniref:helix-turn-helix domain-containing protein n=1 Tax=Desulfosporosinus shakirovi TaxID=2885154 RepID=UPI001E3F44C9|nr:XRE family transcriptional regulator [Desulfosporosinus sp. SRJS8]MCB8814845.1 XRE family transcriptional regulator [Desulfosporosinus sp. SRJS8]
MNDLSNLPEGIPIKDMGRKIRNFRHEKELTVEALANQCNLSPSLISQIERGLSTPSLDSLWKITHALGISLIELFEESSNERVVVIPREEQKVMILPKSNVTYRLLSPVNNQTKLEFLSIVLEPGTSTYRDLVAHKGEECGVVVHGEMTVVAGSKEYLLREGDSIYLDSTIPHRFFNHGDQVAIGIWAMTPASF